MTQDDGKAQAQRARWHLAHLRLPAGGAGCCFGHNIAPGWSWTLCGLRAAGFGTLLGPGSAARRLVTDWMRKAAHALCTEPHGRMQRGEGWQHPFYLSTDVDPPRTDGATKAQVAGQAARLATGGLALLVMSHYSSL